jgi:type IV secretory pathway VirB4 component
VLFGKKPPQPSNQQSAVPKPEASTQSHLEVAEIRDGIIILKDGSLRSILMVSAINFDLKSQEEQNAIIYAYQRFLNALTFPIQIVIHSRPMDLSDYIEKINSLIPKTPSKLLRIQIQDYVTYVQQLLVEANIMDKTFYLVVPYYPTLSAQMTSRKGGFMEQLKTARSGEQPTINLEKFEEYAAKLDERAQIVASGLGSVGLRAIQLNTQEIIELLYMTYNPEEGVLEKAPSYEEISAPVITGQQPK